MSSPTEPIKPSVIFLSFLIMFSSPILFLMLWFTIDLETAYAKIKELSVIIIGDKKP